ncbi:hypothetical protein EMCG_05083 [[Emmonsia] crescens]|uniref:Uncharacterized protein n=1 Tax=[Emmonsia] crescens TaxID=73230 RepID=A0A0G2J6M6_9EURO|nr:hypothetical protein EMCG_05083 [Emmonsia crescens UAMH 3008]
MLTAKDGPPYPRIKPSLPANGNKRPNSKDIAAFTVKRFPGKQDGKGQSVGKGDDCHDVTDELRWLWIWDGNNMDAGVS